MTSRRISLVGEVYLDLFGGVEFKISNPNTTNSMYRQNIEFPQSQLSTEKIYCSQITIAGLNDRSVLVRVPGLAVYRKHVLQFILSLFGLRLWK